MSIFTNTIIRESPVIYGCWRYIEIGSITCYLPRSHTSEILGLQKVETDVIYELNSLISPPPIGRQAKVDISNLDNSGF